MGSAVLSTELQAEAHSSTGGGVGQLSRVFPLSVYFAAFPHRGGGDRGAWRAWLARLVTGELWRSGQRGTQLQRSLTQYLALGGGMNSIEFKT